MDKTPDINLIRRKIKSLCIHLCDNHLYPGNNDYTKAIILSRSRTGSNLLKSLLNSHPGIYFYGEVFRSLQSKDPRELYDSVFSAKPSFINVAGFKIFYYHPEDASFESTWNRLINDKSIKVIHLKRKNLLRTLVSRKIAELNNDWKQTGRSKQNSNKHVFLDKKECEAFFEQTKSWEKQFDELFNEHPKIDVFYEDLINRNHHDLLGDIQNFLDVKEKNLKTNLVRQNPEKLSDLISNYNELKEAFVGGYWEYFFQEKSSI
jgi:LPS sulfotransferase NodH